MTNHTETTLTVRGTDIRVMRGGSGPALLFLHGASGAGAWLPFMDKLAAHFDVIVPEHPGYGGSDDPDWLDDIHDMAYFYKDVLRALDLSDVHLVGLSLGGWIAAELAVRDTSRLASLTLVAAAGVRVKGVSGVDTYLLTPEERIRTMFVDQSLADQMIERVLTPELEDVGLKNLYTTAKLAWQPRSHDPNLPKWLHLIDVPTLILWGGQDKLFPPAHAKAYGEMIPGSKVIVFDQCGHLPTVEKADELVAAIVDFAAQEMKGAA